MGSARNGTRLALAGLLGCVALSSAQAGGFAVREQSASSQGSSFAGAGAGYDLSSMFWNPAAIGIVGSGATTESHYALIIPDADLTGRANLVPTLGGTSIGGAGSTDIGQLALVPASYGAYRLSKDFVVGISINSPFGLATKPDDINWAGRTHARTTKMFTVNASPTLGYQIAPGLFLGAGVQLQYMQARLNFAGGTAANAKNVELDVDDNLGIGFTAGLLWQPSQSTSIGLGFRSSIKHDLEGSLTNFATGPNGPASASIDLETPEIVTLGVRQAIAPHLRLLGTIEWTNWSRFDLLPLSQSPVILPTTIPPGQGLALDPHWHDSWLYSLGLEYDVSRQLTVRTGVAFEKSPVQNASERLLNVPDSDRWWASAGLTYALSSKMAIDLAYTHIFFDDAPIDRLNLTHSIRFVGETNQSADIIAASLKMRW